MNGIIDYEDQNRAYDDADLVQGYPAYIRLAKTFDDGSALITAYQRDAAGRLLVKTLPLKRLSCRAGGRCSPLT